MQYNLVRSSSFNGNRGADFSNKPCVLYIGTHDYRGSDRPARLMHSHANLVEFIYFKDIRGGEGICVAEGYNFKVYSGDLAVFNAGVRHKDDCGLLWCIGVSNVHLPNRNPNHVIGEQVFPPVIKLGKHRHIIEAMMETMINVAEDNSAVSACICQHLFDAFFELIISILNMQTSSYNNPSHMESKQTEKVKNILSYIEEHATENLPLAQIAEEFDMSVSYMSRVLKAETGYSPNEYQRMTRIGLAQTMLMSTNLSMSEIAKEVGFSDQSYFSKQFAAITGFTPLQYRKRYGGVTRGGDLPGLGLPEADDADMNGS